MLSNKSRQGNEEDYAGSWWSGFCWGVRVSGLILHAAGSPLSPSTKRLLGLRYFGGQCRTAWCKEASEAGFQCLDVAGGRQRGEGHREGQRQGWRGSRRGQRRQTSGITFPLSRVFPSEQFWDFPGGPVVKTSSSNAGGAGSIPGWVAKIPYASQPKTQQRLNRSNIVTNSVKT